MTPPAASSNSATTVDLKSTDSGAVAQRHEDPAIAADRSFPLATASGAGAVPVVPSSEAPVDGASDVKLTELGPPYFGRLDLAAEDKIRAFDQFFAMVSSVSCFLFHWEHGSAPDGSSPRGCEQARAVAYSLILLTVFLFAACLPTL